MVEEAMAMAMAPPQLPQQKKNSHKNSNINVINNSLTVFIYLNHKKIVGNWELPRYSCTSQLPMLVFTVTSP